MATPQKAPTYSLPRDTNETARLNAQHKIWLSAVGHYLQPDLASKLPKNAKVADVGTGTGIWLEELAAQSDPAWTFEGLDMSSAQFPSSSAKKVGFKTYNLLQPVPQELKEQYDAVHLRLLLAGLASENDWRTAISSVFELLKPGGYIQWEEANFNHIRVLQATEEAKSTSLQALIDGGTSIMRSKATFPDIIPRLSELFTEAGFLEAKHVVTMSDRDPDTRIGFSRASLGALFAIISFHASRSEGKVDLEVMKKCYDHALAELETGGFVQSDIFCVTGRKPDKV